MACGPPTRAVGRPCRRRKTPFPEGLEVGSDQFQAMRDIFTSLNLGKLMVDAEEAEPAKEKAE